MSLRIHFRPKIQKGGTTYYLYCRIRYDCVIATDFSTFLPLLPTWNQKHQVFLGKDPASREANDRLAEICEDIKEIARHLRRKDEPFDSHDVRNAYVKSRTQRTLLEAYDEHLKLFKKRIGQPGYSKGTYKSHYSRDQNLREFLRFKKMNDIRLDAIRENFGREFVAYLRDEKKHQQNYLVRNLNHLQAILETQVADGYLAKNPLTNMQEKQIKTTSIVYLRESQLELLKNSSHLLTPGQQRVADAFLFQCYTGLAYADLVRFNATQHLMTIHNRKVIMFSRKKTEVPFMIPLLAPAEKLLTKYQGHIPVISNQKMNEILKEIAKAVGIDTHLTTHVGRKTAGTFLLNNDVPIKTVSKILGHASVLTTERTYAHLLDETVLRHTEHLVAV